MLGALPHRFIVSCKILGLEVDAWVDRGLETKWNSE